MVLMNRFAYPAVFEQDASGRVVVSFPDLTGVHTDGADLAEALTEATQALAAAIYFLIKDDRPIPEPSGCEPGQRPVALPAHLATKAALYLAWKDSGISKTELARRLGVSENEARRVLDPRHPSKIQRIEQALAALGKTLVVTMRDAA